MSSHKISASTAQSASTLLPSGKVVQLPTSNPESKSKAAFTKLNIKGMHCSPARKEQFFWDTVCRGLGIRALSSGRRSWIYQYRDEHRRTRRIVLGDVSKVKLEAARHAACQHAASVTQGANPSVERKGKRTAVRVIGIIEAYLKYAKERQRPRSFQETERHLLHHAVPLHHERADTVHRRDIAALLENIDSV